MKNDHPSETFEAEQAVVAALHSRAMVEFELAEARVRLAKATGLRQSKLTLAKAQATWDERARSIDATTRLRPERRRVALLGGDHGMG